MRILLKVIIYFIFLLIAAVGIIWGASRLNDGPLIGPIAGGPLKSGEIVETSVEDWSFAADIQEIQMQLTSQNSSRTVWIMVHKKNAFLGTSRPPDGGWHKGALQDGTAILRIEGKRYPVTLSRVTDEARASEVDQALFEKYESRPGGENGRTFFKVESRPVS